MNTRKDNAFVLRAAREKSINAGIPGGSALMVIFAVLCLTVFAILSLSTALADVRLSDAYADSVTQYYEASCEIEERIALIRAGEMPKGVEANGDIYTLRSPIGDTNTLTVTAKIDGADCEILTRTVEYTAQWEGDSSLNVWSGD